MNRFIVIGLSIDAVYMLINRFVAIIPCMIAIPVLLVGIVCFLIGAVQTKQRGII